MDGWMHGCIHGMTVERDKLQVQGINPLCKGKRILPYTFPRQRIPLKFVIYIASEKEGIVAGPFWALPISLLATFNLHPREVRLLLLSQA